MEKVQVGKRVTLKLNKHMIIELDNNFCQVVTEVKDRSLNNNIYEELFELLAVSVSGQEFIPSIVSGAWDGRLSYVDKQLKFNTGFFPFVLQKMQALGYEIELVDKRINRVERPKLVTQLANWSLRDYQKHLVMAGISNYVEGIYFPRGIYDAATNAGKNSIIASLIKSYNARTLILVHRRELFKQLVETLHEEGIDCGKVSGKTTDLKHITVAMYKTLSNRSVDMEIKSWMAGVNVLIVDECHRASSGDYKTLIDQVKPFACFFMSGTALAAEDDVKRMDILARSGPILGNVTNEFLQDAGHSQRLKIYMIDYDKSIHFLESYKEEQARADYDRNKLAKIKEVCEMFPNDQILISVVKVAHGEYLQKNLIDLPTIVEFVQGSDKDRDDKIERFRTGVSKVMIATQLLKEGVNIPGIRVLINAAGGKSEITLKQIIGRLLRSDGVHDDCIMIDFIDKGDTLSLHTAARMELYKKEKFEIIY